MILLSLSSCSHQNLPKVQTNELALYAGSINNDIHSSSKYNELDEHLRQYDSKFTRINEITTYGPCRGICSQYYIAAFDENNIHSYRCWYLADTECNYPILVENENGRIIDTYRESVTAAKQFASIQRNLPNNCIVGCNLSERKGMIFLYSKDTITHSMLDAIVEDPDSGIYEISVYHQLSEKEYNSLRDNQCYIKTDKWEMLFEYHYLMFENVIKFKDNYSFFKYTDSYVDYENTVTTVPYEFKETSRDIFSTTVITPDIEESAITTIPPSYWDSKYIEFSEKGLYDNYVSKE